MVTVRNGEWEDLRMCETKKLVVGDKVIVTGCLSICEIRAIDDKIAWLKVTDGDLRITRSLADVRLAPKPFAEVVSGSGHMDIWLTINEVKIVGTRNVSPGSFNSYTKKELEDLAECINKTFKERVGSCVYLTTAPLALTRIVVCL